MPVIYQKRVGRTRYEIRTHGKTVRLYTNNVMHTQYHPGRRVSGGVWDLLVLPALALPKVERVLLLGLGGGAVVHLLREWCPGAHITALELNPIHISLARRFFDIKGRDLTLVQGDARDYVENYHGEPFDLVIEDVFQDSEGTPDRAFVADRRWCNALRRLVSKRGALVMNTLSLAQLRGTALIQQDAVHKQWGSHLSLTMPAYANVVGAFYRQAVSPVDLRKIIRSDDKRLQQERSKHLRYKIADWTRSIP
jgi:spermidine synthase